MGRVKKKVDPEHVEALAATGLTEEQIADALGICRRTLENRKAESAQFAQAIKRGKAKGIGVVANKLMEQVKSGNVTAMIFYLKTRAGWREAQSIDHTSSDGSMIPSMPATIELVAPNVDSTD